MRRREFIGLVGPSGVSPARRNGLAARSFVPLGMRPKALGISMSTDLFDLSGRTALVTGSSRGLGRAIAEGMAKDGARLVINGTDAARVEAAAQIGP
jgi:short chain dehydrogenase